MLLPTYASWGQALPAAEASPISTGFTLPHASGSLSYGVSFSESLSKGYYESQGTAASTNLNGNLGYLSSSKRFPFSMIFSGGRSWANNGNPSYGYANLALSQVLSVGRWSAIVADNVSYLPSTPISSLSGVAGVGDVGQTQVPVGADTGQGVLTAYSTRISNTASGSVQRQLTGKTSANAFGSDSLLTFVGNTGNAGLDSNSESGGGGLNHRIDARTSIGGNYSYNTSSYGVGVPGFTSQTASATFTRQLSRKLGLNVAGGPQWSKQGVAGSETALSAFADASLSYAAQFSQLSLAYVRTVNPGYGVSGGGLSDSISFTGGHTFARVWNCGFTTSYARTEALPSAVTASYSYQTQVASFQISRALVRSLSTYASYTLENQTGASTASTTDVFSGLFQVVGFGLTYSPSAIRFGRP